MTIRAVIVNEGERNIGTAKLYVCQKKPDDYIYMEGCYYTYGHSGKQDAEIVFCVTFKGS